MPEGLVLRYLSFAPCYGALAQQIADAVASRATEVGSGRVGRTGKLSLEDKAELAARAHIRHSYTKYETRLDRADLLGLDEYTRRNIRADAQGEVGEFLEKHRR